MTTKIEWATETWNPVTGCTKISPGCENCYAEKMAKRLAGRFGYPKENPFTPGILHRDKIRQPYKWKKPRMIFVCSMGDLFHDAVGIVSQGAVFDTIFANPKHIFMVLTKRPENMADFMSEYVVFNYGVLKNLWLGVTVENQQAADSRVETLLSIPAAVHFASIEPMLGPVNLKKNVRPMRGNNPIWPCSESMLFGLDWIICGGETGPGARACRYEWVAQLRDDCIKEKRPFFFKRWGDSLAPGRKIDGKIWEQYPEVAE